MGLKGILKSTKGFAGLVVRERTVPLLLLCIDIGLFVRGGLANNAKGALSESIDELLESEPDVSLVGDLARN